jgi:hypothetical protein
MILIRVLVVIQKSNSLHRKTMYPRTSYMENTAQAGISYKLIASKMLS